MNDKPITEEIKEKPTIKEEAIQKIQKIRRRDRDICITPPHPHLVDKSVVESETVFNVIGYLLTTSSSFVIGIYYSTPEKSTLRYDYLFGIFFFLGIGFYVYGKWYLHKKINEEKISLSEYYDEYYDEE